MGLRETITAGIATAFGLVDNMKRTITIRRQTAGSYNPTTGAVSRTTTDYPVEAVLTTPTRNELSAPQIRATDTMALWDANDAAIEPQLGMSVLMGSEEYTIAYVQAVGPADAGPAVLWKMALRRPSAEAA